MDLVPSVAAASAGLWLGIVSKAVPEPYMDEVFHIPQAQRYCRGGFAEWDDKITTPPGLYLLSNVLPQTLRALGISWNRSCEPNSLRAFNVVGLAVLAYLFLVCRRRMEARAMSAAEQPLTGFAIHSACNVALFPLLFFFSGLYYTDVVSTVVVLAALVNHLGRVARDCSSIQSDLSTIVLGLMALLMRQTNVFWVVVYMGGLEAIHAIKTLKAESKTLSATKGHPQRLLQTVRAYSVGYVHDPPLHMSEIDDTLLVAFSFGVAALCNPNRVLRQIWPYLTVLGAFVAFVVWNGAVVLGATAMPKEQPSRKPETSRKAENQRSLLRVTYSLVAVFLSCAIVRYNTIIHPFTLADNRHYMFYVFRYSIGRASWIRYMLVGPYLLSCEMVMSAMAGYGSKECQAPGRAPQNQPSSAFSRSSLIREVGAKEPDTTEPARKDWQPGKPSQTGSPSLRPCASTALIWLLATALSLVTTPLVEPRYFIVPWVLWRLQVPDWQLCSDDGGANDGRSAFCCGIAGELFRTRDVRLIIETAWFAFVNLATCYIFIVKPFVWRDEAGAVLDGGRLQRFMW
ncbi:hypothetical protein CDD80_1804 [Ophiocordyceps camponoti-rufipedis]|uniref:Dol-P-Glc:Glc(2)Man(9)GlcNAc(2)-PP-Dol alpha-1,2-glucosyltransferase n=1 Tax=Ophiocordyceps camponoti-rufipedis TaxID=2004952 RepID=A0A2C5XXF3_9HYPO|nr:hypothetical protein CDD80_1804 [Ophiocordyceps camponoti-rufipedis]